MFEAYKLFIIIKFLGGFLMIKLTKFQSKDVDGEFVLNAELIETIEETPDTVITLVNGKKILVEENMNQIVNLAIDYKRALGKFIR